MSGDIFVVSAPSGAGKSTLCKRLLTELANLRFSVSHTTRKPRQGEQDGIQYHFVSREQFSEMIKAGDFLEWAEVHGNFYGTSKKAIEEMLKQGQDVLLDVDVVGAKAVKQQFPESCLIFIMPPSIETLKDRLVSRGTDTTETIDLRLKNAESEIAQALFFEYAVINDDLEQAYREFCSIFMAMRQKLKRIQLKHPQLFSLK